MNKTNPWKRLKSKQIYANPWMQLREDEVIRPDGSPGIYGVVEIGRSAGVVALSKQEELILVGQWRYTHNKYSWEIPTGGIHKKEADPLQGAMRELKEETGVVAGNWQSLGTIDNSNGITDDECHLFLATDLHMQEQDLDVTEDIVVRWLKLKEALQMVMQGEITEASSVAGILKTTLLRREGVL